MLRTFRFEGDIHETLEFMPMSLRRRLDLAGLKLSLVGWQSMPRAERLALCHLSTETPTDVQVYREVLQGFCTRTPAALAEREVLAHDAWPWRQHTPPAEVRARFATLGFEQTPTWWNDCTDEERYVLFRLAAGHREIARFEAALNEIVPALKLRSAP